MPKKWAGVNSKAVEARARKDEQKKTAAEKERKAKEDAYWADDDPRALKQQAKKKQEEEKRAQAAARRAEKKALEEREQQELAKLSKPKPVKVTRADIAVEKQKIALEDKKKVEQTQQASARVTPLPSSSSSTSLDEDEEWEAGLEKNINHIIREQRAAHGENFLEARSVEEALQSLNVSGGEDRHPEKRLKAAFLAYESVQLPIFKQEYPGMKLSQYKEMIWKQWQKAPENPLNQIKRV